MLLYNFPVSLKIHDNTTNVLNNLKKEDLISKKSENRKLENNVVIKISCSDNNINATKSDLLINNLHANTDKESINIENKFVNNNVDIATKNIKEDTNKINFNSNLFQNQTENQNPNSIDEDDKITNLNHSPLHLKGKRRKQTTHPN